MCTCDLESVDLETGLQFNGGGLIINNKRPTINMVMVENEDREMTVQRRLKEAVPVTLNVKINSFWK